MNSRVQRRGISTERGIGGPTFLAGFFFLLLFSGPPTLRLRSPEDSLAGVIDLSVVIQVSAWILAGIWTLYQIRREVKQNSRMKLALPGKLGLVMVLFLSLSTFVSEAPMLTAFKVGQMLVCLLFTWLFVQRYGTAKFLDYIFIGSVILCVGIVIAALTLPDVVFARLPPDDRVRLFGDPVAPTGVVTTYCAILLFIKKRQVPKAAFWALLAVLGTLMALSMTRQAWFLVFGFLLLRLARYAKGPLVRKLGFICLVMFPFVFLYYILPALQEYRTTETIWSLTGRTELWVYLVALTLVQSPWIGLGYYSASRILGPEFNPGMGTAHSMLVEVFLGGGLLSLFPCLVLCFLLARKAVRLLSRKRTEVEFACGSLFFVTLALGLMGADFGYGQAGIIFWGLAAAIPGLVIQPAATPAFAVPMGHHPRYSRPTQVKTLPVRIQRTET